jgi:hypothetical protein
MGIFQLLADTTQARKRGLTLERFQDMDLIDRLVWRWVLVNEKAILEIRKTSNGRVVRYEDLCGRPQEVARDLLSHVGLDWHEQVERFIRQSTQTHKSDYYGVFKDPQQSATKWQKELTNKQISRILSLTAGSLAGGYYGNTDDIL